MTCSSIIQLEKYIVISGWKKNYIRVMKEQDYA